ncbi:MAG: hypothetical protein JNJ85_13600, partial [Candidatus Kapabacteria bacterium]|nr:hypothetical protein [Candidatus Kapabacteria bacterium]
MSYQGVLADPSTGKFLPDGNYKIVVRLYEGVNEDEVVYSETQRVAVVRGVFNMIIGSVNPFPSTMKFDRAYFMGVSVNGGEEMKPRTALTASPYAMYAENAGTAEVAKSLSPDASVVTGINNANGNITLKGDNGINVAQKGNEITITADPALIQFDKSGNKLQNTIYNSGPEIGGTLLMNGTVSGNGYLTLNNNSIALGKLSTTGAANNKSIIYNGSSIVWGNPLPGGTASGDLTGSYPNPTIAANAVTTTKIANGNVTLPKISTAGAGTDQVIKFDGTNVVWGNGFVLPYSNSVNSASTLFDITQTGSGGSGSFAITNAASTGDAIRANQNGLGRGVYSTINNTSNIVAAVRGETNGGGYGVFGQATGNGNAGFFQISNPASTSSTVNVTTNGIGSGITVQLTNASNGARGLDVLQAGVGPGVFATSAGGNAVWGITSSISAAGVIGDNTFGEAVVGRNRGGNGVGAVVGRNDSSGYGCRGFNTKDGIGVLGQAGISGGTGVGGRFENVNAANGNDALQAATNGTGWAGNFTNANNSSASRGIRISTTAGQGGNAISIANGTLSLSRQHPYTSNTTIDDNILVVTAAGNTTIPTGAPLVDGATVWVVNNAGAVVTITNTTVGSFNVDPGRAVQLLFVSTVSGANWIPVQP